MILIGGLTWGGTVNGNPPPDLPSGRCVYYYGFAPATQRLTFDGVYTGVSEIGQYTHTENDTIIGLGAAGRHVFTGPSTGSVDWHGTLTLTSRLGGNLTGQATINNVGTRVVPLSYGGYIFRLPVLPLTHLLCIITPSIQNLVLAAELRRCRCLISQSSVRERSQLKPIRWVLQLSKGLSLRHVRSITGSTLLLLSWPSSAATPTSIG
jgi:hypothetical protein